ncbi:MAG: dephospho-CoA kinase [Solirubrobacterales bacterium]
MEGPPFIGLTGGIGAGKTEALKALGRLGAATVSADALTHDALSEGSVRARLAERWGPEVLDGEEPDRNRIAEIVFSDQDELAWLESVLHPQVRERLVKWRESVDESQPLAVVEVPLLHESGMGPMFDSVVCVVADDDVRRERAAARGLTDFDGRAKRQLSQEEKAAQSDYVIRNEGTVETLEEEVRDLLPLLTAGGE